MSQNGKWSKPGVPHKGWRCINVVDLEVPDATCEMCESKEIRYVHTMKHPDYPDVLKCGCVCAGHMEEDYAAAEGREHELRLAASRRAALAARRQAVRDDLLVDRRHWTEGWYSRYPGEWIRNYRSKQPHDLRLAARDYGCLVRQRPTDGVWEAWVTDRLTHDDSYYHIRSRWITSEPHTSREEAALAAFDGMIALVMDEEPQTVRRLSDEEKQARQEELRAREQARKQAEARRRAEKAERERQEYLRQQELWQQRAADRSRFRNYATYIPNSREEWVQYQRWRVSKKGNMWTTDGAYRIVIGKWSGARWSGIITNRYDEDEQYELVEAYKTEEETKAAVYDALVEIRAEESEEEAT